MIEAVLFDGDQTLWDFQAVMTTALGAVLEELRLARPGPMSDQLAVRDLVADRSDAARANDGREFSMARLRELGFVRTLQRLHSGGDDGEGASPHDDETLAATLTASYFAHRDCDPALFDDVVPCLNALRSRYRLGLLSNGSRVPDTIGLAEYFEVVVFAQDHLVAKPDQAIFAVVEHQLGTEPGACVLVGDHPLNDVVGAKRAGWRSVWIDRAGDGTYIAPEGYLETPDAVITALDQLPGVLLEL